MNIEQYAFNQMADDLIRQKERINKLEKELFETQEVCRLLNKEVNNLKVKLNKMR